MAVKGVDYPHSLKPASMGGKQDGIENHDKVTDQFGGKGIGSAIPPADPEKNRRIREPQEDYVSFSPCSKAKFLVCLVLQGEGSMGSQHHRVHMSLRM